MGTVRVGHGGDGVLPVPIGLRSWGRGPYRAEGFLAVLDVPCSMLQRLLGHALGLLSLLQCLPHRLSRAPHSLCP